jgi:hypothetical protein
MAENFPGNCIAEARESANEVAADRNPMVLAGSAIAILTPCANFLRAFSSGKI